MSIHRPSIKDVAQRSGTSISTVSNVLNDRKFVSDELRTRVLKAVEEMGYSANPIARSLKSRRSGLVGVIISDINCVFFAPMLKGIQNVLARAGYSMVTCDSNYKADRAVEYIKKLQGHWADGLILAGMSVEECTDFFENLAQSPASDKQVPIVSVERDLSAYRIDSVLIDNELASRTATSHLVEVGCRRIAHITGPQIAGLAGERYAGYLHALAQAGIESDTALVCRGDFSPISGYNAVRQLLQTDVPFDGVFAANDQMAVGALRALSNAGLAVPEAVKVVGFDNTFIASIVMPALTTISVPNYEMGTRATHMLLERIQEPERATRVDRLDFELIVRQSTMASARTNWDMSYW
ncbi:MAG: LacI family transcriptional regulator [Clostridiales bacterium]|nr:LacI family transcriptional regulator [Clostridiales bacterium]